MGTVQHAVVGIQSRSSVCCLGCSAIGIVNWECIGDVCNARLDSTDNRVIVSLVQLSAWLKPLRSFYDFCSANCR